MGTAFNNAMPKKSQPSLTADEIAEKASRGEDISACFTNRFKVVKPSSGERSKRKPRLKRKAG
jgi:hypothetical protein